MSGTARLMLFARADLPCSVSRHGYSRRAASPIAVEPAYPSPCCPNNKPPRSAGSPWVPQMTGYEKSPDYGDPPGNSGIGVIIVVAAVAIVLLVLVLG